MNDNTQCNNIYSVSNLSLLPFLLESSTSLRLVNTFLLESRKGSLSIKRERVFFREEDIAKRIEKTRDSLPQHEKWFAIRIVRNKQQNKTHWKPRDSLPQQEQVIPFGTKDIACKRQNETRLKIKRQSATATTTRSHSLI